MEIGSSSEHLLRTSNLTNGDVKEIITYEMSRTPHFLKSAKLLQTARDKDGEYWHGDNCTIKSNAVNHGRYSNFGDCGESVIWIPKNREDWIKSIDEMTNLCREAALRSSVLLDTKRFDDPLSKAYIKDRIDIDDPLRGFQICHKFGGWMQGFVLTTTFTTWTLYFKWDSKHPQSGMVGNTKARPNAPGRAGWDSNGVMARELEKQHRSGDPHGGGVVWHNVAELSLIGGLGCGEYLLRMALDDISRRGVYDYVVLQATPSSVSFYEKFGFIRVGAIAKYSNSRIVGYRHWAYANESNLNYHGGPSYMMARKIPKRDVGFSFLDALKEHIVSTKPVIMPQIFDTVTVPHAFPSVHQSLAKKRKRVSKAVSLSQTRSKNSDSGYKPRTPRRKKPLVIKTNMKIVERSRFSTPELVPSVDQKEINKNQERVQTRQCMTENLKDCKDCKSQLRKQRVTDVYRDSSIEKFFNKVVAKRGVERTLDSYCFVVYYGGQDTDILHVIPLEARGQFAGKRVGRIKFRSVANADIVSVPVIEWEVVKAVMVTKTALIANESWDIKHGLT